MWLQCPFERGLVGERPPLAVDPLDHEAGLDRGRDRLAPEIGGPAFGDARAQEGEAGADDKGHRQHGQADAPQAQHPEPLRWPAPGALGPPGGGRGALCVATRMLQEADDKLAETDAAIGGLLGDQRQAASCPAGC